MSELTEEEESIELLPCPFCGEVSFLEFHDDEQRYLQWHPTCSSCEAIIPQNFCERSEAAAAWNKRAESALREYQARCVELVERLADVDFKSGSVPELWNAARELVAEKPKEPEQ